MIEVTSSADGLLYQGHRAAGFDRCCQVGRARQWLLHSFFVIRHAFEVACGA